MADTKQLISLSRVNATGGLDYYYPKTVAQQVFVDESSGKTVADHVADTDIHLSAAERTALNKVNRADGFVQLGADGFVPTSLLNPAVMAIHTEFATTTELLAAPVDSIAEGQIVMVTDATGDQTVKSGWAIYRRKAGTQVLNTLDSWQKIAEAESIDVVLRWDNVVGRPTSTVTDIDDAVAKKHEHANKAVLDELTNSGTDEAPVLSFKGNALAYTADVAKFFVTETAEVPAGARTNDFVFVKTGTL